MSRKRFDHPDQLTLDGFDAAPPATDRLFFAILPDAETAGRIEALQLALREQHGLRGRAIAIERLHVTLHLLGDHAGLPAALLAAARVAADAVAELRIPPFELRFDRAASFEGSPGNRPFALRSGEGPSALTAFQQTLGQMLRRVGIGDITQQPFTPHLTLGYDKKRVDEQPVEAIGWTAREFVLMHSLIGQTRHLPLARWPLGG